MRVLKMDTVEDVPPMNGEWRQNYTQIHESEFHEDAFKREMKYLTL